LFAACPPQDIRGGMGSCRRGLGSWPLNMDSITKNSRIASHNPLPNSLDSSVCNLQLGIPNMTNNTILLDVMLRSPNQVKPIVSPACFECPSHRRPTHRPPTTNKMLAAVLNPWHLPWPRAGGRWRLVVLLPFFVLVPSYVFIITYESILEL
jgi:hypothetical protein